MPNKLTWTQPNAQGSIVGYILYRRIGPGAINTLTDLLAFVPAEPREYLDFAIDFVTLEAPGYNYGVSALNQGGEGDLSNLVLITFIHDELVWTEPWEFALTGTVEQFQWTESWPATFVSQYVEDWEIVLPSTPVLEYVEAWEVILPSIPVLSYVELWEPDIPSVPVEQYTEDWNDIPPINISDPGALGYTENWEGLVISNPGAPQWIEDFEAAPITDPGTPEWVEDFSILDFESPGTIQYTEDWELPLIEALGTLVYDEDWEVPALTEPGTPIYDEDWEAPVITDPGTPIYDEDWEVPVIEDPGTLIYDECWEIQLPILGPPAPGYAGVGESYEPLQALAWPGSSGAPYFLPDDATQVYSEDFETP